MTDRDTSAQSATADSATGTFLAVPFRGLLGAMTKLTPARSGRVGGRSIVVLDEMLPAEEVAALTAALEDGRFKRSEYARPDTIDHKHWVIEPISPETEAPSLQAVTTQAVEQFFGEGYEPSRTYCNVALYGDMLMTHSDCREQDEQSHSALVRHHAVERRVGR